MSTKKKGTLTTSKEWAKHLRKFNKRQFWKGERVETKRYISYEIEIKESKRLKVLVENYRKNPLHAILELRDKPLCVSDLLSVANKFRMSSVLIGELAELSERTVKSKSKSALISIQISEKLLMLELLYASGIEAFNNKDVFIEWLNTELLPLNFQKPVDLITTYFGIKIVTELIGQITHGIYS